MEDLSTTLSNNISQANKALQTRDYATAKDCVRRAAECALLLAKQSVKPQQKNEYFNKYKELKELLDGINAKLGATPHSSDSQPHHSEAPQPPKQSDYVPAPPKADDKPHYNKTGNRDKDFLKPRWLNDYLGQPQAVTAVGDLINAANLKNSAMPHLILYGSHGLGKTTFANIIANELHVGFTELNVTKVNQDEMIATLGKLKPRDVLFIDEIHNLPVAVAESVLYSAMQDGRIVYTEGKGKNARTREVNLVPFTLIGATTEIGKLPKPFTQRAIQIRLEEYSDEVLAVIISRSFFKLGMKINGGNSLLIAKRCRNNPRIANNMVKRISDKALVRFAAMNNLQPGSLSSTEAIRKLGIEVETKVIKEFFEENGIDEYGLEKGDRELLKIIIDRYNGGPVGIDTLSRVMNEANNVIAQKYEAYLIKKGMMKIERDGRVVMPLAYKVLGLPVPKGLTQDSTPALKEEEALKYAVRKIVASHIPDVEKCVDVEKLIVYPPNAVCSTQNLDELFPDIIKDYEAETKHLCKLIIDFGEINRTLICDSFLESRFACKVVEAGYAKDLKAQSLEIPYVSQEMANHRYFPDLIIKDYRNRIAIVELKNYEMVSYHMNIDKYETLRDFCTQRGYGYAEVVKDENNKYTSCEAIKNRPVNTKLEQFVIERIKDNGKNGGEGHFTMEDFNDYIKANGATDRVELYTILLNNRKLKNIDRVGDKLNVVLVGE